MKRGVDAEFVRGAAYEIKPAGERFSAEADLRPPYDSIGERISTWPSGASLYAARLDPFASAFLTSSPTVLEGPDPSTHWEFGGGVPQTVLTAQVRGKSDVRVGLTGASPSCRSRSYRTSWRISFR